MKRQVFYSFHYNYDVMRVQLIRNIGALEGNKPVSENEWEQVKRKGDAAIKNWIDENMKNRSCVIVLIGAETANRKWVQYEIRKAWDEGKGLLGIYIHNVPSMGRRCRKGENPFKKITLEDGRNLSTVVKCYDPVSTNAYYSIARNLENWVEEAIASRR